jgi:aspartate racemase
VPGLNSGRNRQNIATLIAMKTIGIVGGIGPESTIDYYRLLIAAGHTQIIINSVAVHRLVGMMLSGDTTGVADYLTDAVEQLAKAGADIAIIAANTPHVAYPEVRSRSRIPMVSIVEAVAAYVHAAGMTKVGLLGTRFTMEGQFYRDVFARRGLSLEAPRRDDLEYVHTKYMSEFLHNQFVPETRDGVLRVIDRMKEDSGVQAVILGGTELPILLRTDNHNGLPLLDTTKIHADAVLKTARDQ